MPVITFSITAPQVQALRVFKQGQESDNLTAKRILLESISQTSASPFQSQAEMKDILQRLEAIEKRLEAIESHGSGRKLK